MDPKNESVFTMQPLSPDECIKQTSTRVSQTSDVEQGQVTVTRERGHLHQSFSPRKLQVGWRCLLRLQNAYRHTDHSTWFKHRQRIVHRHR
jgi:hypothetical protein